ncbi:MAG: nitroreductase family protein [Deltaproteobacteria bacterium]|nr:nitroreductase family protein [Deltaproteobacteria bacterium]
MDPLRRLMRLVMARRSCRAFTARPIQEETLDRIHEATTALPSVEGQQSGRAFLVRDPDMAHELVDVLVTGFTSKINIWLARGERPPAFVVCAGDPERSPVKEGRYLYNVDAAMAGEAAVLAAASHEIDSIWLAAIGERRVVEFLGLPKGQRVNSLIALGHGRKGGLHDAVLQKVVSGRRKPLSDIAFDGRFGVPLVVQPPDPTRRAAAIDLYGVHDGHVDVSLPPPSHAFEGLPDDDQLRLVLDAARWAPNADNAQLWRWVVIREHGVIETVLEAAGVPGAVESGSFMLIAGCAAPVLIKHRTKQQPFALIDVPIAIVHQIAMASAGGLGWNLLVNFNYSQVGRALGLPRDHSPVALLMLGRPASGEPPPWQQML